jgi:hypothetical protein
LQTYIEGLLYTGHQNIQIKVIMVLLEVGKLHQFKKGELSNNVAILGLKTDTVLLIFHN